MRAKKWLADGTAVAPRQSAVSETRWLLLLFIISISILFTALGSAALFEPDEGRNAEKARELLLLGDWVTPHQNFLPTLDKPIMLYWLIALAFELFGISEWSARLPSTLAAFGGVWLIYDFARRRWGFWEALWSSLVLVTSLQFLIFSRLVIFDMVLTFFITWALISFHRIVESDPHSVRVRDTVGLFLGMALGTLVKGPIALITPGMIILGFLLFTGRWSVLRQIRPLVGISLYLAVVAPWYALAEIRNPGFLQYFVWQEHFVRFFTPRFNRNESWYYFFMVLALGFLPWTVVLPSVVRQFWCEKLASTNLFLMLWVALPFAFFSVSNSKLPHYILPIYPPLALMVGRLVGARLRERTRGDWFILLAPWLVVIFMMAYLVVGLVFPPMLAREIRTAVITHRLSVSVAALALTVIFLVVSLGQVKNFGRDSGFTYLCTAVGLALFLVLSTQIIATASFNRVSKPLAHLAAPFVEARHQLVFYDTYLEGVPFYLRVEKPIWLVQSRERQNIMASNYLAARRPAPAAGYGAVVLSYEEFAARWKDGGQSLRVILKEKNLERFSRSIGHASKQLVRYENYYLVADR